MRNSKGGQVKILWLARPVVPTLAKNARMGHPAITIEVSRRILSVNI